MIFQLAAASLALSVQTAPQAAPSPVPTKEPKICRREEAAIGSRLSRTRQVCKTAAQWKAEREEQRAEIDNARRDSSGK